jgi:hypothetical protein
VALLIPGIAFPIDRMFGYGILLIHLLEYDLYASIQEYCE